MDFESIKRLGLEYVRNIDAQASDEIYNPTTNNHTIILRLKKQERIICPNCGLVNKVKLRSTVTQCFNHSSGIENNIIIKLKRRVFKCECGRVFKEENPFTSSKRKNSLQKEFKMLMALKDINKSFSDVAKDFNVSTTTVINTFDAKVDIKRQTLTEVISVDEVYSKHFAYKHYCFIVYSPQLDKILDVLNSRNKEDLISYFSRIPESERKRVKYFSMDLYDVYRQVAKLCLPNTIICADHFHVIKNLCDCFNKGRIRIMKKYEHLKHNNDSWYWLYKKYWKLLLTNPSKLTYKKFQVNRSGMHLDQHQIVDYMLKIDDKLASAYELMNDYKVFNQTASINDAEERLDELIVRFHNSEFDEYYQFYKLLKNWRSEIINSFHRVNGYIISNGGMERTNRDVKTLIRHAYGFKNFDRVRNRIMYVINEDAPILSDRKEKINR